MSHVCIFISAPNEVSALHPGSTVLKANTIRSSQPKESKSIECQVEESELLARTISTQVSDSDLRPMSLPAHAHFKLAEEDTQSNLTELDDTVNGVLRPVGSTNQLHGILRKTPSAKFGSQSTFAVDNPSLSGFSLSESSSTNNLHGMKRKSVVSGSEGDFRTKRSSSIGKKLAMFHLGGEHHTSHSDLRSPSSDNSMVKEKQKLDSFGSQ